MLTVALVLLFTLSFAFLATYGVTRPWWRSWEGRALVTSATGWALISGGFLIDEYATEVPDIAWVTIAYVAVLSAALKLWMFHRARRR